MSENSELNPTNPGSNEDGQILRHSVVIFLGVLVSIEAVLVAAGAIYFLSRIFLETPDNFTGAMVIFGITVIIAAGLIWAAVATFRGQSWTRGAIITWQILQFAVAISFIQGIQTWQPVGWGLLCLSVTSLGLVIAGLVSQKPS